MAQLNALDTQIHQVISEASEAQKKAYDPKRSVWLSASAGTGKTYVLIRRLLSLFLTDKQLHPSEVLALTFTKAAAEEMQQRFIKELQVWSSASEPDLTRCIEPLLDRPATREDLNRARTLLTTVLDAHPPLSITTLHAFAGKTLSRFPIESGFWPGGRYIG